MAIWTAALASASVILVYAAQLGLGRWQLDEFNYVFDHRLYGWGAFAARLFISPRPISELLIYLYDSCVLLWHRPLVVPALGALWLGTVIILVVSAWYGLRPSRTRLAAALALGLTPMAFTLVADPVTEAFYWLVATVAYLPALAGATSLLFLLGSDMTLPRRCWCCAALLLSALSHEIGAALAIGFALVTGAMALTSTPRSIRSAWWALLPGLMGLTVLASLVLFRSGTVDLGSDHKVYTGHLVASAVAAAWQMAWDIVSSGNGADGWAAIGATTAQKLVFAAGFGLVWLRYGRGELSWLHGALLAGLAGGIYFSLLAAYYHYGDLCCERHATTRQWLILLSLAIIAAAALGRLTAVQNLPSWLGPALLLLSLGSIVQRASGLRADFAVLGMAEQAQQRTWQSGLAPGPGMQFYLPPDHPTMLIHGTAEPVATYDLTVQAPELITGVGRFFGKRFISVCQPWQSDKSFLINGHEFIPACPPHDGPPDIVFDTAP